MLLLWAILLLIPVRQHFCYVPERIYFNSYLDSPPLVTLSSIGLAQCIEECKARKRCYSIRYKRTFRLCFLHQEENALSPTVSERGFVSARKADWNIEAFKDCEDCNDNQACSITTRSAGSCSRKECRPPPAIYRHGNMNSLGSRVCYGKTSDVSLWRCSRCVAGGWTCNEDWTFRNFHCYLVVSDTKKSWDHAQDFCSTRGSYLVNIKREAENAFIKRLIGSGDYWTGGREMNVRGNWRWSDNSEIKFKDWGSGEPDEDTDINMNCLMIRLSGWKDRHCTGTKKFICEKDFL